MKRISMFKITTSVSQKNNDLKMELLKGMTFLRSTEGDEPEEQGSSQEENIQRIGVSKKLLFLF